METFDYAILQDPRRFAEHRMPAHSDHRFFDPDGAEPVCSLNGDWFYRWSPNVAEARRTLAGFEQPETDCSGWDTIRVPGHVELQGHGAPQYVNIQYPWDGSEELQPGDTPTRYNPVSTYVRSFTLPERFRGRRVYLSFQGAESALAVWLNGKYIGFGEDAFTPSEFEVTDALTEGENKLAVQVFRYTCASWCEDQDFFRFSGLFRDVLLYAMPRVHIFDLDLPRCASPRRPPHPAGRFTPCLTGARWSPVLRARSMPRSSSAFPSPGFGAPRPPRSTGSKSRCWTRTASPPNASRSRSASAGLKSGTA